MNVLIQYSNGWGHLIFSVVLVVCLTVLLALGKIDTETFYLVTGPIVLFWFGTGIGNRISEARAAPPLQQEKTL